MAGPPRAPTPKAGPAGGGLRPPPARGERLPLPGMGVFFVSREPVRARQPLADFASVARGLEERAAGTAFPGTLSVPSQGRWVIANCAKGLGRAAESAFVEVYEYDPVRYQALVIGLVEPPPDTPVHWICRRVNPDARVVAVLDATAATPEASGTFPAPRGYLGNTDTVLAYGKLLRGRPTCRIEGVGTICWAAGADTLAELVAASSK